MAIGGTDNDKTWDMANIKAYDGERATAVADGVKLYSHEAATVTVNGVTVKADKFADVSKLASDGEMTVNGSYSSGLTFDADENIVAMTFKVKLLDTAFVGTRDADGAWLTLDATSGMEFIHQMPGYLGYRFRTGNWGTQKFTDTENANLYTDGVEMGYYIDGN